MADTTQDWRARIEGKLDQLHVLLTGNSKPHTGVIVRLDRLEQRAGRSAWVSRSLVGALISAAVSLVCAALYVALRT